MAGEKSKPASNCLWRDTAEGEDSLGFKPYVEAIAEFLTAEGTKPPITLSIEGQWGCGKSSFMKQLEGHIEKLNKSENENSEEVGSNGHIDIETDSEITGRGFWGTLFPKNKYFVVWFNCWRYEKEDELWAAFALHFMEQLSEQLSWERRLWAQFKLRILRLEFKWKSKKSIFAHIALFILAAWVFLDHSIPNFVEFLSTDSPDGSSGSVLIALTKIIAPVLPILYVGKDIIDVVGNPFNFSKFVSNPNYKEHISFIEHFHSDFGKIVESYVGDSRVYVFVDDLDRCEVPKAAELMQALNLMISDDANVYFSIGMDRKVISAGLAARNENILPYLEEVDGLKFGYDFIEKFIQLPFKVPSPTNADFKKFLNLQQEQESSLKTSDTSGDLSSKFEAPDSGSQPDEKSAPQESPESFNLEEEVKAESPKEESDNPKPVTNDDDCEDPGELDHILEMVVPALDRNPRRVKQFFNLFRFQRTIGKKTGLFSYDSKTLPENMWNCRKLAKFVVISINWHSLISALGSNRTLLDQLQEYALNLGNENEYLKKWTKDEKLISLLRFGCEGNDPQKKLEDYTLSGLDFSKLLQISPVVVYPDENLSGSLLEIEFVRIPAGEFMMGSPLNDQERFDNEGPVHKVTIKNSFSMSKYPITQKQWIALMEFNPSQFKGEERPVENVSWTDVQEFIKRLNEMDGTDRYRLPSEAEWEYACRAGTNTRYSFGDDESKLGDYAWYVGNSDNETHPVGQRDSNLWGLYDIHGNVWEWVQDSYHSNYIGAPSDGSAWEDGDSSNRVIRLGGFNGSARYCRSAVRTGGGPGVHGSNIGFRLLREL